jgi:medium-chain acyl-[acyl-carrier-protein] hydrolase
MRADMTLLETYRQPSMPPLPCPIACFWGRHDPHLNLEGMAAWQQLTSGSFRTQLFDGDHFYLKQQPQLLLNAIQQQLATLVVLSGR